MRLFPRFPSVFVNACVLPLVLACSGAGLRGGGTGSSGAEGDPKTEPPVEDTEVLATDPPQMVTGAFLVECADVDVSDTQRTVGCGVSDEATRRKQEDATLVSVTVRVGAVAAFAPALTPAPGHPSFHATLTLDVGRNDVVRITEATASVGGAEVVLPVAYVSSADCPAGEVRIPAGGCERLVDVFTWRNPTPGAWANLFVAGSAPALEASLPGEGYVRDVVPGFKALPPIACPDFDCIPSRDAPLFLADGTVGIFELRKGLEVLTGQGREALARAQNDGWTLVRMSFRLLAAKQKDAERLFRYRTTNVAPLSWILLLEPQTAAPPAPYDTVDGPIGWAIP